MEIEKDGGFPRFESQKFDVSSHAVFTCLLRVPYTYAGTLATHFYFVCFQEACRLERLPKLAKAKENHGKMKRSSETVDTNIGKKLNGLSNFTPSNKRRRRLAGDQDSITEISSISTDVIQAVSGGSFRPISFDMSYQGSQLKPDSTGVSSIQTSSSRTIDFSAFQNPISGENSGDDDTVLQQLKEGSADGYLGALDFNDPEWLSKQPIIQSPSIAFADGSKGTESDPFILECSGTIQNAWAKKLQSSDPTTMRRRRSRRLQEGFSETNVEFAVEYWLRRTILREEGVLITVTLGGVTGQGGNDDLFKAAKDLIGVDVSHSMYPVVSSVLANTMVSMSYSQSI